MTTFNPPRANEDLDVTTSNVEPVAETESISERASESTDSSDNNERQKKREPNEVIAIVGQSARYAGAANLREYWRNLISGRNTVVEIPKSRWDVSQYFDPRQGVEGKTYSKWLGALDDIDCFDPTFFNIAPSEAEMMDPQHRLFLQEAYRAFEDAGYSRAALNNCSCGVYLGIMHNEYGLILQKAMGDRAVSMLTSSSFSIAAARIAYYLNLKGPAISIDTACSSSLVALHVGCQALRSGEVDMALVGGVTLYLMAETYVGMSTAGMLSPAGQCKPFDHLADGMVPGEGVGAMVLKRLSDAEAANDIIYGVILASAINQDGKTNGITAPNLDSQTQLVRRLYREHDIHPESIDYVEMHGTGTKMGDPIELRALATAFGERTQRKHFCAIGSVKGNIGHASAAAGLASVQKVLLSLQHEGLPPSVNFSAPNPLFDFASSPFVVNTEAKPWTRRDSAKSRRAAVSSFGMSGTNVHVVIEEYRPSTASLAPVSNAVAIVLSARNDTQLRERARLLLDAAQQDQWCDADLQRIAFTLQTGRDAMDVRFAFVATSLHQFCDVLRRFANGSPDADAEKGTCYGSAKKHKEFVQTFGRNEDFKEIVGKWLRRRKLHELINLWVRGFTVQWARLYGEWRPRRMSLPTYPFAKERYWVSASLPEKVTNGASLTPAAMLHPLVQRNTSSLTEHRYTSTFSGAEFFFDNGAQGAKNFPGAAYLEMARAAVTLSQNARPNAVLLFKNVQCLEPLTVDQEVDVQIGLYSAANDAIEVEVYKEYDDGESVHFTAEASTIAATMPSTDIDSRCENCLQQGPKGIYSDLYAAVDASYLIGKVVLTEGIQIAEYGLHPTMLSAALQICGEFPRVAVTQSFSMKRMTIFSAAPAHAWVYARSVAATFDIDICTRDGLVCVRIEGLCFQSAVESLDQNLSAVARVTDDDIDNAVPLTFEEYWVEAPREISNHITIKTLVCFLEDSASHQAIDDLLRLLSPQATVILISGGQAYRKLSAARYQIAVEETSSIRTAFEDIHRTHQRIDGLLYFSTFRDLSFRSVIRPLVNFLQALDTKGFSCPRVAICATTSDGIDRCYADAWIAFEPSLRLVLPKTEVVVLRRERQAVDADANAPLQKDFVNAWEELKTDRFESVVYCDEKRLVRRVRPTALQSAEIAVRRGGNYLITGGAGGLGLAFAEWFAAEGAANIILLGRSALETTKQAHLQALQTRDVNVCYVQADVCDVNGLTEVLRPVIDRVGELNGVIHAAGIEASGDLFSNSLSHFERVVASKIDGTMILDRVLGELLDGKSLDYLCCFSSSAAILGDFGSCDYALGNRFQMAYADYRQRHIKGLAPARKVIAINWPWWKSGGMNAGQGDSAELYLQSSGQRALETEEGVRLFGRLLAQPASHQLVLVGRQDRLHRFLKLTPTQLKPVTPSAITTVVTEAETRADSGRDTEENVALELKAQASRLLKLERSVLDGDENLATFGFDSIKLTEYARRLSSLYRIDIKPSIFFSYPTLNKLTQYLLSEQGDALRAFYRERVSNPGSKPEPVVSVVKSAVKNKRRERGARSSLARVPALATLNVQEPIAIIGMSGRFPKARSVDELWALLSKGVDAVEEIPLERFDWRRAFINSRNVGKWVGAIPGVAEFDPLFFEISPHEAELMDPRQRLLLQEAWQALEDAGVGAAHLARQKVGMFVGAEQGDYQQLLAQHDLVTSNHDAILAARLAYFLNLNGPTMTINTACSSGLVAAHQACLSLRAGECDMAIAAAVSLLLTPQPFVAMSQAGMLSTQGRCSTFDESADGMVPSEAVVALVFKRLATAVADGDPIYAVVRGDGINYDGKTNGITAPSGLAQQSLLKEVYARARIDAKRIEYIVAHGTGTKLGDPIEVNALNEVFKAATKETAFCALTSTKSNVGHALAASGLVNLVGLVQALRHELIPPSLHCARENQHIEWRDSPFYVNKAPRPWPQRAEERVGAVSAFGMSGTNAHMVVASYEIPRCEITSPPYFLLVVSGKTEAARKASEQRLVVFLQSRQWERSELLSLSVTLLTGRHHFAYRSALVVADVNSAIQQLGASLSATAQLPHLVSGKVPVDFRPPRILQTQAEALLVKARELQIDRALESTEYQQVLQALANLYCQGYELNFEQLYGTVSIPRMHAPTYPFANDRYWIGSAELTRDAQATLHPLLHRNTSSLEEHRYTSTFTGEEMFFRDHLVGGHKILPGVAYLEMARAAAAFANQHAPNSDAILRLKNIAWFRPLMVQDKAVDVHIAIRPCENAVDFEVYTYDHNEQRTAHCRGQVIVDVGLVPPAQDLAAIRARCKNNEYSADQCYRAFDTMGIQYGPTHRTVVSVGVGMDTDGRRIACGNVVRSPLDNESYVLPPGLLDGGLQSAVGFLIDGAGLSKGPLVPPLPFALDDIIVFDAITTQSVVIIREATAQNTDVQKLNVDICDVAGRVCVRLTGFSSRFLRETLSVEDRTAQQASRDEGLPAMRALTLMPVWEPQILNVAAEPWPAADASVLVIGGTAEQLRQLRKQCPLLMTLNLATDASIELFEQAIASLASLDHLFLIAPETVSAELTDATVIDEQQHGVLAHFRLLKALLRCGYDRKALALTMITVRALGVLQDENIHPTHAGIHGLAGSLAKEYPQWRIRTVDLDKGIDWPASLLSVPTDPAGDVYALRGDVWWRQRLLPCNLPPVLHSRFRRGGVYVVIGGAGGVGEAFSDYLVRHYQAQLVWLGRRELAADIQAKIDRLSKIGPAPHYICADATNRDSLSRAYDVIRTAYGEVNGLVHAALVLADQSIGNMDEAGFANTLESKVDTIVNMTQVFAGASFDWVLFFSSLQSFTKAPGQSNYAAGCVFGDAVAYRIAQSWSCAVKVINWGYWGSVGAVASVGYRERMSKLGMGSIESAEAMEILEQFLAAPIPQLAFVKTSAPEVLAHGAHETIVFAAGELSRLAKVGAASTASRFGSVAGWLDDALERTAEANDQIARITCSQLHNLGAINLWQGSELRELDDAPKVSSWIAQALRMLKAQSYLVFNGENWSPRITIDAEEAMRQWLRYREKAKTDAWIGAQIILADVCLLALPDVLTARQRATDVIFPNASLELVEHVYKDNALAEYFNEVLAEAVHAFITAQLQINPAARFKIMEIGAGTGSTTDAVLRRLETCHESLDEYRYTDVSEAFLMQARERYADGHPYLKTAILDIEQTFPQSIDIGSFDVVIAANVLHATSNIRQTLRNAKAALKLHGLLLLNELSAPDWFTHVTFGLLDGWWKSASDDVRTAGWPGLGPDQWLSVLQQEGFDSIQFPAAAQHAAGQQIVLAISNGVIRQVNARSERPAFVHANIDSAYEEEDTSVAQARETFNNVTDDVQLRERAKAYLQKIIGATLKLSPQQIETKESFQKYGIDSLLVIRLTNALRESFPAVSNTLFFEYRTIDALAGFLIESEYDALTKVVGLKSAPAMRPVARAASVENVGHIVRPEKIRPAVRQRDEREKETASLGIQDVAIVGLAGRFPQANDVEAFWENIKSGKNCIREVPQDRWDWRKFYAEEKGAENTIYSKWGGFLDEIDKFDPLFFRISPREAHRMDPQERLFLQEAYACIEDAGYTPSTLSASRKVGVFVGVMNGAYQKVTTYWSIANRVSYLFDFVGPSLAVDTACSSSLTAIHLALESIYSGTSDCAIAGGVHLIADPDQYRALSAMTMLTSSDKCRAFGEHADGFVDGEGVGAIVLKPLTLAIADGDHIYGVIKGSMINSGGRTHGYSVPNPTAQTQVIVDAWRRAQIDPRTLSYIEAHGTGTSLGDPIEIAGLTKAFQQYSQDRQFCAIGSVKSNIGHLEAAAGIAGLTKILLQFQHETLAPTLHAETPNPSIDFAATPFVLQRELGHWCRPTLTKANGATQEHPRVAGISSFGAGGANAHLIVEEYLDRRAAENRSHADVAQTVLIVLSGRNAESLRSRIEHLRETITKRNYRETDLRSIAFTLQVGREAMQCRLAFSATSIAELSEKLSLALDGGTSHEIYRGDTSVNHDAFATFIADDDMPALIETWIAKSKYEMLLDAWVRGFVIDWHRLYEQQPTRISLPTYSFARERYWLSATTDSSATQPAVLHPLLHTNTSDLNAQRFTSHFSGREYFFADHHVHGRALLPGAAFLEMARAALVQASGAQGERLPIRLTNVLWLQPIVGNAAIDVHITMRPRDDDSVDYEIYSGTEAERKYHAEGIAIFAEGTAPMIDLRKLRSDCKVDLSPTHCYEAFLSIGLHYGAAFRALKSVKVGGDRSAPYVIADLQLASQYSDQPPGQSSDQLQTSHSPFVLHPSLLDSAFQACIGLSMHDGELQPRAMVPFSVDSIEIYVALPSDAVVYLRQIETAAADLVVDIDICDLIGRVCVRLRRFTARILAAERLPLSDSPLTHAIVAENKIDHKESGVGALMFTVDWRKASFPAVAMSPSQQENILIVGGSLAQISPLLECFPSAHLIANRNTESIDGLTTRIAALGLLNHVLWIAPSSLAVDVAADAMIEEQQQGVFSCLRLIKALLQAGYEQQELGFTAITTDSLVVIDADASIPTHSSVHGLVGSLAAEFPNWRVRAIDAQQTDSMIDLLAVPSDVLGNVCAKRGSQWYRQALVKHPFDTAAIGGFKTGGVYVLLGGAGGIGVALSEYLITRYAAKVTWIGRRQIDDDIAKHIARLGTLGSEPRYISADATDRDSLTRACEEINRIDGPINGVVHAAFALLDKGLLAMDEARFAQALAAKIDVSVRLTQVFESQPLDFVLFMSSMQSFVKRPGQSNYAAGCVFEDTFASALAQRWPCAVKTINWGYWGSVGAAATPELKQRMEEIGLASIEAEEGMQALEILLTGSQHQLAFIKTTHPDVAKGLLALDRMEQTTTHEDEMPRAITHNSAQSVEQYVRQIVIETFSSAINLNASQIDPAKSFPDYGLDSIVGVQLSRTLNKKLSITLSSASLFAFASANKLTAHILDKFADKIVVPRFLESIPVAIAADVAEPISLRSSPTKGSRRFAPIATALPKVPADHGAAQNQTADGIAIIGLGGRFPHARTLDEFWQRLAGRSDLITELSADRWSLDDFYEPDLETAIAAGKSYNKWGGFIPAVKEFDFDFFVVDSTVSLSLHTRHFMEATWHAVESAGYTRESLQRESNNKVGVYVGAMADTGDLWTGAIAMNVATHFGCTGPCVAVDAMSASSMSALHLACEAIRSGECELAIAGGVNVLSDSKLRMHSYFRDLGANQDCRSYTAKNGMHLAECASAVILKPLSKAIAAGDPIRAVIRWSHTCHIGGVDGKVVPNMDMLAGKIATSLRKASIDARSIGYVESACTGYKIGDEMEMTMLTAVFKQFTDEKHFCRLGTVKSNMGHAEAASGISQFAKVVLQFDHKQLVPLLRLGPIDPQLDLSDSPFRLQWELESWPRTLDRSGMHVEHPRRALINSLGMGGTFSSVLIDEYMPAAVTERRTADTQSNVDGSHVIVLSAKNRERLQAAVLQLQTFVCSNPLRDLGSFAYTLQVGREAMLERIAFVVSNLSELQSSLAACADYLSGNIERDMAISVWSSDVALDDNETTEVMMTKHSPLNPLDMTTSKLAASWVKGAVIDWQRIYKTRPRRMLLPQYPFKHTPETRPAASSS